MYQFFYNVVWYGFILPVTHCADGFGILMTRIAGLGINSDGYMSLYLPTFVVGLLMFVVAYLSLIAWAISRVTKWACRLKATTMHTGAPG